MPFDVINAIPKQPLFVPLDELGVIEVSGADAVSFLQSQLTNDVAGLASQRLQLNGYCTPKGRLLAVFDNWRTDEAVYLQLPREILAPVMKRLSMFVLRAKAKLADRSGDFRAAGLIGPGSAAAIRNARNALQIDAPTQAWQRIEHDGVSVARLPSGERIAERFLFTAPAAQFEQLAQSLEQSHNAERAPSSLWWWSQIDAALPTVFAATQEKFVPQMINLEVLGGVNFKKGCYPGQEIVARSQYLGKLRRRMQRAHIDDTTTAGADVFAEGEAQAIGVIVMAAPAPGGGMDVLFECAVDRIQAGLHVNSADGPQLSLQQLPYELHDVTA